MEGLKYLSEFQQRTFARNTEICSRFNELVKVHGKIGSSWQYSRIIGEEMGIQAMTVATVLRKMGLYYKVRDVQK